MVFNQHYAYQHQLLQEGDISLDKNQYSSLVFTMIAPLSLELVYVKIAETIPLQVCPVSRNKL